MARFFIAGANFLGGARAIIRGRDAEHVQVLRIRPGEDVTICDTQGSDYKCRLVRSDKEEAEFEVVEVVPCKGEPSVDVTVLCGLPKGDRVDYIIQKSVEAGAHVIVFFQSNRISEEAAKQSGRGIIPQVSWAPDYGEVLNTAVHHDLPLFMYETGDREALDAVLEANKTVSSVSILTGPEGGFEPFEADLARIAGLHICSMGQRILRCETAPVVAVTAVMYATGNLS